METKSKTVLAIAHGRRAIGFATADRLGLIDADLLILQSCKTTEVLLAKARSEIEERLARENPDVVIVEKLSPKRRTATSLALEGIIQVCADKRPETIIAQATRTEACAQFETKEKRLSGKIRAIAKSLQAGNPEFKFHAPPNLRMRTDWDRLWGQAVAASALALHGRKYF